MQMKKILLKSKLERFIAIRVLILYLVAAAIILVFFRHLPLLLAGLTLGVFLSLLRLNSNAGTLASVLTAPEEGGAVRKSVTGFIINSLIVIVVLAASLKINQWLFGGVIAGIFFVPLVIIINGITEALGITHNNYE